MSNILVIAPHPDDETLGCGGTLLRHRQSGDDIHWLIVAAITANQAFADRIQGRKREIATVVAAYGFASTTELGFETTTLDALPMNALVVGSSATKWFRYPSVKRVLAYETISETNFGIAPDMLPFRPNSYIDISPWLDKKIEIMACYEGEMGTHPFPRSQTAIRAQATLRSAEAGVSVAEAFMLLKEIV